MDIYITETYDTEYGNTVRTKRTGSRNFTDAMSKALDEVNRITAKFPNHTIADCTGDAKIVINYDEYFSTVINVYCVKDIS